MSKKLIDGAWIIVCDWVDEKGNACNLGAFGKPKMFVDPDAGQNPETHFQCGAHHGVIKQEDDPNFQLPEEHKLQESALVKDGTEASEDISIRPDDFKPDLEGHVWDGTKPHKE